MTKVMFYYYLDWIIFHPRFGMLMIALIALSLVQEPTLALILFTFFVVELSARTTLFLHQRKLSPYRSLSQNRLPLLFFIFDLLATLSLLITIFDLPMDIQLLALLRLLRAAYLLRTLRFIRHIDLHTMMFSPAYGMFISIIIITSFFVTDTLLWVITLFFFAELGIRLMIMRNMAFESTKERRIEWTLWCMDLLATLFMLPFFEVSTYSSGLRMLRLVRLFKPWKIIFSNLREVLRQGQFVQEINLMVLILAVLSLIIGGFFFFFIEPQYYLATAVTGQPPIVSAIWHAFRLLTDPGNSSEDPGTTIVIIASVISVILGVFVFAFFIGIGANIVSGLMKRLRNERLISNNHIVIIGWSPAAPYIVKQLALIAEQTYSQLKVILLHHEDSVPMEIVEDKWVTYRQGIVSNPADLRRVHLSAANLALYISPEKLPESLSVSKAFQSMVSIRRDNPTIRLCIAFPGMIHPRLASHQHMLQVGWDKQGKYSNPTVALSETEFRTTALCNILRYSDFDHVFQRLMIPELPDDSGMLMIEWIALLQKEHGEWFLSTPDTTAKAAIKRMAPVLFQRGVILVSVILDDSTALPIYKLDELEEESLQISMLLGISVNEALFYGELTNAIQRESTLPLLNSMDQEPSDIGLEIQEPEYKMKLLIIGSVGSLPLLLKQLLRFYQELELIVLDNLSSDEIDSEKKYIKRRVAEEPGLDELITITVKSWNFADMEFLRKYIIRANHIILCPPHHLDDLTFSLVTTILSSIVTITEDEQVSPQIFPVLQTINQASLLQQELSGIQLSVEIHVTVLNELYGAFVSHSIYNMHSARTTADYKIKQTMRESLKKLMTDTGESAEMGLKIFSITQPLPDDAIELFHLLQASGYIWIGYTLNHPYNGSESVNQVLQYLLPRRLDHQSDRQNHIIINPFSSPISSHCWQTNKNDIIELITIGGDNDVELF
ncbi:MAG: hypothetical protein Q9M31_00265 [Mariprofundus sp.]|nr:hypothetical protein [Mariprofundus sp.]